MKIKYSGASNGKKPVNAATGGKIPYDLVSMLVALRDYADVSDAYVNDEHGKLVDIADSLYNVGRDVIEKMKPEFKKVYEKYGKDYFDEVLDDVSALDSQLTRNNVNDLIADYEDRANNFNGVEGACSGKRRSVRAASSNDYIYVIMNNGDPVAKGTYDAMTKKSLTYNYPVTIKKFPKAKLNSLMKMAKEARRPDPLKFAVNRFINDYPDEYRAINSSVKAPIKSSDAVMAGPGAGYTIKWNLESIKSINSFNVTNVSEPDQYGLITAEADCDVDVTVEIVEAYSYYYGIDSPLNDVPAKMTKVKFEIDPELWPEIGSLYDADVAFAEELLNNEIYDTISNGEVMYGGGWLHSTWDGTLTDYDHDDLIEVKVTDEEIIQYVDDAVSGALEPAYDEDEYDEYDEVEESITASNEKMIVDPDILQTFLDNGFEPAGGWNAGEPVIYDNEPYLDKFMWLGFGCTYNVKNHKAYVWWSPKGNQIDLPFEYDINSEIDAASLCDDLYTWDEYNIDELLEAGLPLIGATKDENGIFTYEDEGLVAKIDLELNRGSVTDDWGTKDYNNLQDLLEAADIIG